ncbi:MAG: hypothetical protein M3Y74_00220 [Chloroflexota bacterium]|nr:hypothetical protein [Chloroflexota bacterium]
MFATVMMGAVKGRQRVHESAASSAAAVVQDVSRGTPSRRWRAVGTWRTALLLLMAVALAGEQLLFLKGSASSVRPHHGTAAHLPDTQRISMLVADALGASDRGVKRVQLVGARADPTHKGARIVTLTWAINGDLSLGSVSSGAQLDVYLILQNLYTAHLPISDIRMTGTFGERGSHGHDREVPVMIVGMDAAVARVIDWQNMDATTVWPLVHHYMIRPGFECQCQE